MAPGYLEKFGLDTRLGYLEEEAVAPGIPGESGRATWLPGEGGRAAWLPREGGRAA